MKIISVKQMRELDRRTIEEAGISGSLLMEKAGNGAGEKILEYLGNMDFSHIKRFVLLAGKGNNGGDVYVIARFLFENCAADVIVFSICPIKELSGDAKYHAELLPEDIIVEVKPKLSPADFSKGDIIVDGLLGTGFNGSLRESYKNWIAAVNTADLPVIAVDIPSGLNGDTGAVSEDAVKADLTVTIAQPKAGLIAGHGPVYCGQLSVVDIGIPEQYVDEIDSGLSLFSESDAYLLINRVPVNSHKNALGSVLVIGGSSLYPGAPFLAAKAALRSGAGIVAVAVPESAGINNPGFFSVITRMIPDSGKGFFTKSSIPEILKLAAKADSIVIGPGMSDNKSCVDVLKEILSIDKPVIIDADALNLLAANPGILNKKRNSKFIFTPHPGESRRLLNGFGLKSFVDKDRISQTKKLQGKTGGTVVLKGHRTIVAAEKNSVSVNGSGCPALATAGSGDVLTGIIAANSAAGMDSFDAACLSVFVHGLAGELGNRGMRGLIADDLPDLIPAVMKRLSPFA
jgi:ADP-dependent NAD(P)H-hydrate dehydratase / NAD(P)H-hydrate epimerase